MRNLIALAPLALLAACGGGAANNAATAAYYGHSECMVERMGSPLDGDVVMLCNCVGERAREGQNREQSLASCRHRLGLDFGDQPITNAMIQ